MIVREGKPVYADEAPCDGNYSNGTPCKKMARYVTGDGYLRCGVHSGSTPEAKQRRRELVRNPRAQEHKDAMAAICYERASAVARDRLASRESLRPCAITASPLSMGKEKQFEPLEGFLPVFPNRHHGHAFNYASGDNSWLSPMRLGPVLHGQPGLVASMSIENYHQFNKVYPEELSDMPCRCPRAKEWPHFTPATSFYHNRIKGYEDATSRRHKILYATVEDRNDGEKTAKKRGRDCGGDRMKGLPLYSVHSNPEGTERHFTYVESRYFYCYQMEKLVEAGGYSANAMRGLVRKLELGFKLEIVGYDAYRPSGTDKEALYVHYCDPDRPFGHEMVILTLLAARWDGWRLPDDLPWHRYRREHAEVY